ncbi:MAG: phospholipid/cholesterol/gamma-HCH transport system substrate-binding protein [Bradymonadia bacterium]|jgi:phospholipid/cholesterol/gamma-HCH transport system substrate-binding protein
MGATRAQRVRLGIFVGVGLAAMAAGLIILAGMSLGEQRDAYTIRYDDGAVSLSGLEVGSPVKYSGIRVGRVDVIRIDPKDVGVVVVEISLNENTPVATDSKASLGSMGITGLKYIELTRGSKDAVIRSPGDTIPPGMSALDGLANQAGEIAEKVNTALDRVNTFVGPDMKQRVASVLDRTDKLLETTEATIAENRESMKTFSTNLAAASARFDDISLRFDRLLADSQPHVQRAVRDGARTMRNVRDTSSELAGFLTQSRKALGSADKLMQAGNTTLLQSRESLVDGLRDLRAAAENFKDFSRRIREDPSLLIIREGDE